MESDSNKEKKPETIPDQKENEIKKDEANINYIKAEIQIKNTDVKEKIRIINSFEHYKSIKKFKDTKDDCKFENEKEIKENCEIKINDKIIPFNYFHKFKKKGKYTIEYIFKKDITNMSYMFCECELLQNIDFSHFNTKNVTNMGALFFKCTSLTNINLTNVNTENVSDMTCHIFLLQFLKRNN